MPIGFTTINDFSLLDDRPVGAGFFSWKPKLRRFGFQPNKKTSRDKCDVRHQHDQAKLQHA